jgi:hypothetical protein
VIAIKTTLGLLALTLLALFALVTRKLKLGREVVFLLTPAFVYLFIAMSTGMNIGARHLLPFYGFLFVLAGAGAALLAARSRGWLIACAVLLAAHAVSSLAVFPNDMAYANEMWGGPANTHNLLSDANVDWAQELFQVKAWQDRHPGEECWFAYFAYPEINPETYGIRCHHLPSADTGWLGGAENTPPFINGTVLLSAGDLSGCEFSTAAENPYAAFQRMKPEETISYSVMVYRGSFDMSRAGVEARAQNAPRALRRGDTAVALHLAEEAAAMDTTQPRGLVLLGDTLSRMGRGEEARRAWGMAAARAYQLDPAAQAAFTRGMEARLKK